MSQAPAKGAHLCLQHVPHMRPAPYDMATPPSTRANLPMRLFTWLRCPIISSRSCNAVVLEINAAVGSFQRVEWRWYARRNGAGEREREQSCCAILNAAEF